MGKYGEQVGSKRGPWGISSGTFLDEVEVIKSLKKPLKHGFEAQKPSKMAKNRRKILILMTLSKFLELSSRVSAQRKAFSWVRIV